LKYLSAILLGIILLFCTVAVLQYGNEDVHPKAVLVENPVIMGNTLKFKTKNLEDTYTIILPKDITISQKDEIRLSYELHNKKIIEIEEIIINNKPVWDVSNQNMIDIIVDRDQKNSDLITR